MDASAFNTIYFTNTGLESVSMSLSLSEPGFNLVLNRCNGMNLLKNQTCYIIVSTTNDQLSQTNNLADLKNNNVHLVNLKKTKSASSGGAIFLQSAISMNDFLTHDVSVQNQSSSSKSFSFSFSGTDASKFSIVLNRCVNVPARSSCLVSIKLKPQLAGSYSASLSDSQISGSVSLSSTITGSTAGVIPSSTESISLSTSSLSFGTVKRFGVSSALSFNVQNTGNKTISPIVTTTSKMAITLNRCLVVLVPGASCSVSVAMKSAYPDENGSFVGQSVSVKSSISASPQLISASATLMVPPAYILGQAQGGICPSGQHFEGLVCVADAVVNYPQGCSDIKFRNASATSGYYEVDFDAEGSLPHQNVYCDFSGPIPYLEIFDIDREPTLTDSDILNRLNQFTTTPITAEHLIRDPAPVFNPGVTWINSASNNSAYTYGIDKVQSVGMSIKFYKNTLEPASYEGGFALFDSATTANCNPDVYGVGSCYSGRYQSSGRTGFMAFDGGSGGSNWAWDVFIGANVYTYSNERNIYVADSTPTHSYLSTFGRDNSPNSGRTLFYINSLKIQDFFLQYPRSCAEAKSKGFTNSNNTTGSGVYTMDYDGAAVYYSPTQVYCDMSGAGVATLTNSCDNALLFGQKSLNNDNLSGLYSIDFDGVGTGNSPVSNYCDMAGGAWSSNSGGYTLVGVFDLPTSGYSSSSSLSLASADSYLNNADYQSLLSHSHEMIARTMRNDSTEYVMKTPASELSIVNCGSNIASSTLNPQSHYGGILISWAWKEQDCNLSGADYSLFGIRVDSGPYFYAYSLNNNGSHPSSYWNWGNNSYTVPFFDYHVPKNPGEKLYIFMK